MVIVDVVKMKEMEDQALQRIKAKLVFKNANIVDVLAGRIITADLAISGSTIIGIGEYSGEVEVDMRDKYICPAFINAHVHFESCMVLPSELLKLTLANGTTTYIMDPHEAANVKGNDGIDFMLEQTKDVPANVYCMIPSCVPATAVDDSANTLRAKDLEKYVNNPRVRGLAEVMDIDAIISADKALFDKINLFKDKVIDGHMPGLPLNTLNAVVAAGINSDHEADSYDYSQKEISAGVHVHIREGSAAKNLDNIIKGIVKNQISTEEFSFCTDDKHIQDIVCEGEIDYNVRRAIKLGLNPVNAIQIASINTARFYGLKHLGAIAPGKQADFLVLDKLEEISIIQVYHKGKKIFDKFTNQYPVLEPKKVEKTFLDTVKLKNFSLDMLELKNSGENFPVIQIVNNQIITKKLNCSIPNENSLFVPNREFNKIVSIERHKGTGKYSVGVVNNFGLNNAAIATSVSHDSHNLLAIGDNDKDILLAINELIKLSGGYVLASNGKILASLPLPIMGLMSNEGLVEVELKILELSKCLENLGVNKNIDPFITLSFMSLTAIPEIKIIPSGVYDVLEKRFLK